MSQVPRLVKVIQTDSPYFKIISPEDVSHKVAPGMASVFRILFNPEDKKDYTHELICMTEREKFIVPVQVIFFQCCFQVKRIRIYFPI